MNDDFNLTDSLTGVYSKSCFLSRFPEEIERVRKYNSKLTMLYVDHDNLRNVNENHGWNVGDDVLRKFCKTASAILRFSDPVFRLGGDDFVILLPNTEQTAGFEIAMRLQDSFYEDFEINAHLPQTSVSIGMSVYATDSFHPEQLLNIAYNRLTEAKFRGRNQVVFEPETELACPFNLDSARLLERESPLKEFKRFFSNLSGSKRGVFGIIGSSGIGLHRFLDKTIPVASHSGYKTIKLAGRIKDRNSYGSFAEFIKQKTGVPYEIHCDNAETLIRESLCVSKLNKLTVMIDRIESLDDDSMMILQAIFENPSIPVVGIVFTSEDPTYLEAFSSITTYRKQVTLHPLSQHALRMLISNSLGWEPPSRFLEWCFKQTAGYPKILENILNHLIKRGVLFKSENNDWMILDHFHELLILNRWNFPKLKIHCHPNDLSGMEEEYKELDYYFRTKPVVTLFGRGGTGKSHLARAFIRQREAAFEDGVYSLSSSHASGHDLISIVAATIKLAFYGNLSHKFQLFNFLRSKRMLFLIDDYRITDTEKKILIELIQACPQISIIVTAEEPLKIPDEAAIEIKGLKYPQTDLVNDIDRYPSICFFYKAALDSGVNLTYNAAHRADASRICRCLSGAPLAISLVANWLSILSCREIADFLESQALHSKEPTFNTLSESILRAMNFCYSHMNQDEKSLLLYLSVFRESFNRDALCAISNITVSQLHGLKSKKLIYTRADGRYCMHDVIREFTRMKLEQYKDEKQRIQLKHAEYYGSLIHQKLGIFERQREPEFVDFVRMELANLIDGWQFLAKSGNWPVLSHYIEGLNLFFTETTQFAEGCSVFQTALNYLSRSEVRSREAFFLYGRLLYLQAVMFHSASQYEDARKGLEKSLSLFQNIDAPKETALVFDSLGNVYRRLGKISEARKHHEESLSLFTRINNSEGIAESLSNLGKTRSVLGQNREADLAFEKSLALFKKLKNSKKEATILLELAISKGKLGDLETQSRYLAESLKIREKLGDRPGIASCLEIQGYVQHFHGNFLMAQKVLYESLEIRQELNDRWGTALAMLNLAQVFKSIGDFEEAREYLRTCLSMFREIGYKRGIARSLHRIGELMAVVETNQKALEFLHDAFGLFEEIGDILGMVQCRNSIAIVLIQQNHVEQAKRLLLQNLEPCFKIGHIQASLELLFSVTTAWLNEDAPNLFKIIELLGFLKEQTQLSFDLRVKVEATLEELKHKTNADIFTLALKKGSTQNLADFLTLLFQQYVQKENDPG